MPSFCIKPIIIDGVKFLFNCRKYHESSQENEWFISFLDIDQDIQEQQSLRKDIDIQKSNARYQCRLY